MNNKTLIKAAKRFVRHDLKYHVNSKTILIYLRKTGYSVVFYEAEKGNSLITEYGLSDLSKTVNAITVCKGNNNFIFVRTGLSEEKLLYALIHETAHITLGHLSADRLPIDPRLEEMEAEAFAYTVLTHGSIFRMMR